MKINSKYMSLNIPMFNRWIIQNNAVGEEFMSCKYNGAGKTDGSDSFEM